jgi:hypothetical protein
MKLSRKMTFSTGRKIFRTLPTECGCCMLMSIPIKARNGHDQQRKTKARHSSRLLVAWGWFAEHISLIRQFQALSLKQKHYHHRFQTKVLEFMVAILAGLQHLQAISLASHPLKKDQAVAQAWEQPA